MPVSALDCALHSLELQPHILLKIIRIEMVQRFRAIPAAEDVHQTLVYYCSVSKADIGLTDKGNVVKHSGRRFLFVAEHDPVDLVAVWVRMMLDLSPAIGCDSVLVDVFEDLHLISPSIDEETVLVPDEGVVSPCFWSASSSSGLLTLPVASESFLSAIAFSSASPDRAALELIPLLLLHFVLEEVIKVGSTLPGVPSEEIETVPVGKCPSS